MLVYDWSVWLLRHLYPPTCLLCGRPGLGDLDLCRGCCADLPHNLMACPVCARPLPGSPGAPSTACGLCQRHPPAFDRCLCALRYAGTVPYLVQTFKYRGRLATARVLAPLLAEYLEPRLDALPQRLIPVPLHPTRLRERGYNQAQELARRIGQQLGVAIDPFACRRIRPTSPQTTLSRAERLRNPLGCFATDADLGGCHLAIVDDVVTTAATVDSLARTLRAAGATRVDDWAVARAAGD
jgi:ComF family protein